MCVLIVCVSVCACVCVSVGASLIVCCHMGIIIIMLLTESVV